MKISCSTHHLIKYETQKITKNLLLHACISGAVFNNGQRNKNNIKERQDIIIIDFENNLEYWNELLLKMKPWTYIAFKSPGQDEIQDTDGKGKAGDKVDLQKYRVIVQSQPLSINIDEFVYQMEGFFKDIGYNKNKVDWPVTKDPARYFSPPVTKHVTLPIDKPGISYQEALDSIVFNKGSQYIPKADYKFSNAYMDRVMAEENLRMRKTTNGFGKSVFEEFLETRSVTEFLPEWFIQVSNDGLGDGSWTHADSKGAGVNVGKGSGDIYLAYIHHSNSALEGGRAYNALQLYCIQRYGDMYTESFKKLGKYLSAVKKNKVLDHNKDVRAIMAELKKRK